MNNIILNKVINRMYGIADSKYTIYLESVHFGQDSISLNFISFPKDLTKLFQSDHSARFELETSIENYKKIKNTAPIDIKLFIDNKNVSDLEIINSILNELIIVEYKSESSNYMKYMSEKMINSAQKEKKIRDEVYSAFTHAHSLPLKKCIEIANTLKKIDRLL